jgi:putative membrane protein
MKALTLTSAVFLAAAGVTAAQQAGPSDPQIAHIAYTAGQLDITAAKQALRKSKNPQVRAFAEEMARDHAAVNEKAVALVTRLKVTPQANPTSEGLSRQAADTDKRLETLEGAAFDKAYVANEAAYHQTVNNALRTVLIPNADNAELKSLLQTGLTLFQEHQMHAEHLAQTVR